MIAIAHRSFWRWVAMAAILLFAAIPIAIWLVNPSLTDYLQGDSFRQMLDRATAKGLHLQNTSFGPIRRTGFFSAATDGFKGDEGQKAITELSTGPATASFNPWGILLRRWQLQHIGVKSGVVRIQTYEPVPEPKALKPWYALFLPDRVYLSEVVCDETDILWRFRDDNAGFFGTRLLITPYGRDFEYRAKGGEFKMEFVPKLRLRNLHLLITKQRLTLYDLNLAPEENGSAFIRVKGEAGLRDDKSVDVQSTFEDLPLAPWLPRSWRAFVRGKASGDFHWKGSDTKMENSRGDASLRIKDGRIAGAPFLDKLASITGKPLLRSLHLDSCSFKIEWAYPHLEIKDIEIEAAGVIRAEGGLTVDEKRLGGSIQLGVARQYLTWLPKGGEAIFSRAHDGYQWTTVQFSGTAKAPKQDLSPRIMALVSKSPSAMMGVFYRQVGDFFSGGP